MTLTAALQVVVVEKGARPGDNWKRRYDRLHLHDIIDECHLPYMQMPDNFPTFPTRVQYGNYLQAYQIALGINVLAQSTVSQVRTHPTLTAFMLGGRAGAERSVSLCLSGDEGRGWALERGCARRVRLAVRGDAAYMLPPSCARDIVEQSRAELQR